MGEVQKLPDDGQDAIAAMILEEIADDRRWDDAFAPSQDQLGRLANRVREDIRAGRTQDVGIDELRTLASPKISWLVSRPCRNPSRPRHGRLTGFGGRTRPIPACSSRRCILANPSTRPASVWDGGCWDYWRATRSTGSGLGRTWNTIGCFNSCKARTKGCRRAGVRSVAGGCVFPSPPPDPGRSVVEEGSLPLNDDRRKPYTSDVRRPACRRDRPSSSSRRKERCPWTAAPATHGVGCREGALAVRREVEWHLPQMVPGR